MSISTFQDFIINIDDIKNLPKKDKENLDFAQNKPLKSFKDVDSALRSYSADIKEKISSLTNLMIGIIFVMGLAILGWFSEGVYRTYTSVYDFKNELQIIKIENQQLKNDIKNIHDDMELLVEKKYSEILRTQITTPKTGSSQ